MKFKYIILTAILFFFSKTVKVDAGYSEIDHSDLRSTFDEVLIGNWGIYERIENGLALNCNVCPRVEFDTLKTAIITLSSGEVEKYIWNTSNDSLSIKAVDRNISTHYLTNAEYKMTFQKGKDFIELKLFLKTNLELILRKNNK